MCVLNPGRIGIFPVSMRALLIAVSCSHFWLVGVVHADDAPAGSSGVVVLDVPQTRKGADQGLLVRELLRQSLLIAARDEFGLGTRDTVFGDPLSSAESAAAKPLEISISNGPDDKTLVLKVTVRDSGNPAASKQFPLTMEKPYAFERLVTLTEAMSRKEFVAILEQAGYQRQTIKPASTATIEKKTAKQLQQLSGLTQFAALRQLHADMRQSGESPELLRGLAEGYAMLGTLTEYHWSPAHKVFKARGLLYAERQLVKYPGQSAFHVRAYVRALIGLHKGASEDLAANAKQAASGLASEQLLTRAAVIDAFCQWNEAELSLLGDSSDHRPLARYLQLLAAESMDLYETRLEAVKNLQKIAPNTMRAIASALDHAPLGIQRQLDATAGPLFTNLLYKELALIKDLPRTVNDLVNSPPQDFEDEILHRVKLVQALRDAGSAERDHDEPSLAVAGQLIEEESFVIAWRMITLMRYSLGINADELLIKWRPMTKGHHYSGWIESHIWNEAASTQALQRLVANVDDPNLESTEDPFIDMVEEFPNAPALKRKSLEHGDVVFRDLIDAVRRGVGAPAKLLATQRLREISPNAPATRAAAVSNEWSYAKTQAADWETRYASDTLTLNALGKRYADLGRLKDAERCLKASIAVVPDHKTYQVLADLYQSEGNDAQWVAISLESLKAPTYGLEGTITHVALAEYFMKKKDFPTAQVHADAAAESGAGWAMTCAAKCHEYLGEWEAAEAQMRDNSERYETEQMDWYFWCRRTGHGNLAAAKELAMNFVARAETSQDEDDRTKVAVYYYLNDQLERSLTIYRELLKEYQKPFDGLHAAVIAEEMGNKELRNTLLSEAQKAAAQGGAPVLSLIRDLRNSLAAKPVPINFKLNAWRMRSVPDQGSTNWLYFIGKFLIAQGQTDRGINYVQQAASSPITHKFTAMMASVSLARRKITPEKIRVTEFDEETSTLVDIVFPAYEHLQKKRFDKAQSLVDRALKQSHNWLDALYLNGRIAHERGQ